MKITDYNVFFWKGILGNWHKVPEPGILYKGIYFPTAEHVFMYQKAEFFEDNEIAEKIKNTVSPREAKDLGRQVKNYDDDAWANVRTEAMFTAIWLRAKVDTEFKNTLIKLGTGGKYGSRGFVEASPYDTIWGIGMSEENEGITDKKNWRGKNLLGNLLENATEILKIYHNWQDDLIWCPSQCYYSFENKQGKPMLLYLRWRHDDPWRAEVYQYGEDGTLNWNNCIDLCPPFFKDSQLEELKKWCLEKIKELE